MPGRPQATLAQTHLVTKQIPASPITAVLFDMDGTVVDTEPFWANCVAQLSSEHGGRWDPAADRHHLIGILVPDLVALLKQRGVRMDSDDLSAALTDCVARRIEVNPPWCGGALDLLSRLASRAIPTALVTTSIRHHACAVAAAAPPGCFEVVVAAEDVTRHKPDPEAYRLAARLLAVNPGECVVIEDSVPGITAALNFGARTISVDPRIELPATLATHPALRRVTGLEQVAALLGV